MVYNSKRSLWLNCNCVLIGILCLTGCSSREESDLPPTGPPFGVQLSDVTGVSLIRIQESNSRRSSSGGGNNEAHIDAVGVDLISCLRTASNNQDPIISLTDLPSGEYSLSAKVGQGGRQGLTKKLCYAFSKALECNVSRRMIETEVVVLTCPDPNSLKLSPHSDPSPDGFYEHEDLDDNVRRTHFGATLDQLAWFAGYISRAMAGKTDTAKGKRQLRIVYVNETGIDGLFSGSVEWTPSDPYITRSSLVDMGFTLTEARRTIPAIVVEPLSEGEK